ncbi:tyrosine-protein phosphatase [Rhodococcoides fascians A25f]|uniref:tyrosine-protein phosphatase n=1 Tax=Rhodococcoides fascians TaxID=1828 RepID=UPI000560A3A2|nr:tyrosine-protein phosphatase [Rhodococcus fascians]QII07346.1 tyrosine-protein phosphatase [Rhodococcus fascians A25f]
MKTTAGPVNLRDLGGLPVLGGGTSHPRVLYRGDALYPGDSTPQQVDTWPPAVVIDLRSDEEIDRVGYRWPPGPVVHRHSLFDAAAPEREIPNTLQEIYSAMVRDRGRRIAETVALAAHADGPVLVHCAVGKDRTGVVVAVLLLAAGVEPWAVTGDYLATQRNLPLLRERLRSKADPNIERAQTRSPVARGLFTVSPDAISEVVDIVTSWPGGPTGWLTDHGASRADIDLWRRRFTAQ